ncbi:M14 family zinc carboxypeptidase [Rothia sp. ARF10]|nr:M14 family zinc carboxypeptidase [Rothia sp. ARF10]
MSSRHPSRLRSAIVVGLTACALAAAPAATSVADPPPTTPGGPWGGTNLSGIHSYEQLWSTLRQVDGSAKGAFDLSPAPLQSNTGRDIPVVTIGDGPTDVMFIANQHGDEFVVSEGMLSLIRTLSNGSKASQEIRDALTVTIVPRVNVDGFDADVTDTAGRTTPWRQNFDTRCKAAPCDPFYQVGRGYDINRYHSYSESAYDHPYIAGEDELNPVPEAIAMRLLWDERQPALVVDYHHQGTYVDDDGRMITGSIMWPNADEEAARLGLGDAWTQDVEDSQRAVAVMLNSVESKGYANITRYPSTTTPGIARNAYALLGSASVLFELRGDIGQKSAGYIAKTAETTGYALLSSVADGSWLSTDLAPVENLPERGEPVEAPEHQHG